MLVINRVRVLGSGPHTPTKFFWEFPPLPGLTQWSQRPTLSADLICIHRHMTSRNQGTFSREEERGPWEQGWEIISYWSADKLSSIYYLSLDRRKLYFTNSVQKSGDVCLSRPLVPTSHVLEPHTCSRLMSLSPQIPKSPHCHVPEFHVPRPSLQSPSPCPTFHSTKRPPDQLHSNCIVTTSFP